MRATILVLSLIVAAGGITAVTIADAHAQATCRAKCTEDEQACLKRTNNKGQCGNTANQCLAKCK